MNHIHYQNLADAVKYYSDYDFRYIEVPWWVTSDIANLTKPTGISENSNYKLSVNGKCLVASGEQAFLYLANKGHLVPGQYQTVTPCFRNEEYDHYHSKQFMKLELIRLFEYKLVDSKVLVQSMVEEMALCAFNFFSSFVKAIDPKLANSITRVYTGVDDPIALPDTKQVDVVLNVDGHAIELGSYGARTTSFATWVYGTGLAEPRFSKALKEFKCRTL